MGLPGTNVRVSGTGFTAGHAIGIYFGGTTVAHQTITSTTFNIYFDVPDDAEPGSYKVEVIDWDVSPPQTVASDWFTVIGGVIDLDPEVGPVGTGVQISGDNFSDREDITVEYDGDEIEIGSGDSRTDTNGEFTCIIIIPESTRGDHTITVEDESGIYAEAEFTVEPEITIIPTSGVGGDEVLVSGTGFRASRSVTMTFDGDTITTSPTSVRTDGRGSFSASFDIPVGTKGTYEVEASDGTYEASADFALSVSFSISETSGYVGTGITVSGTGFRPSRSISITFGNIQVGTTTTDANGNFTGSFLVPGIASGAYEVRVSDGINTGNADFTVLLSFSISQTSGYVGNEVVVSGIGFRTSKSINITFGNIQVGTATSDANSNFTSSFLVPGLASGTYEVRVSDGVNTGNADFTVLLSFSISQTSGYVGNEVVVSGIGFRTSKSINITFGNIQVGTATSDANSNFTSSFLVPGLASGTYEVRVSDGVNTGDADFTVLLSVSLSPTTSQASPGYVRTKLTISGVGFKPNGTITIKYDDTQVATAPADSSGVFSVTFSAPASIGGDHTITASDTYNTKQFTFTMESTPPPVPEPLLPEMAAKAKSEAYFDWEGVIDPSGVTYTLQIASDADFNDIVLKKVGLADSEYTITEEEKLESVSKEEPYYWRVRAIDGASNNGPWTGARSFRVGFIFTMPGWAIYTLLGVGALLLGVFGFWLGRRTAYSSY